MTTHPSIRTGHVGINVSDLDRSAAFYAHAFGFETVGRSDEPGRRFAFLGNGGTLFLTLWEQSDGTFDTRRPGLHHLSFEVDSVEAVREAQERVRAAGAAFLHEGVVPHAEGASSGGIFFTDPDGIRLEIYAPEGAEGGVAPTPGAPTCGFF